MSKPKIQPPNIRLDPEYLGMAGEIANYHGLPNVAAVVRWLLTREWREVVEPYQIRAAQAQAQKPKSNGEGRS